MKIEASLGTGQSSELFSIDTLPHFEILDRSKIDTGRDGASLYLKQTVVITSWDSGSWQLPAAIRNGRVARQQSIDVRYTSPWDPKAPYHDIKGIAPVKNPGRPTWWWYLIGLAVAIALFLLFFPKSKKNAATFIDLNAYRKAMQALEKLEKEGQPTAQPKPFYTELVNILRGYLKGAKGIQSFSKTTDDLGIQLQALKLPADVDNRLLQTLRLSDLVKFAEYRPDAAAATAALASIKESLNAIEQRHAV